MVQITDEEFQIFFEGLHALYGISNMITRTSEEKRKQIKALIDKYQPLYK